MAANIVRPSLSLSNTHSLVYTPIDTNQTLIQSSSSQTYVSQFLNILVYDLSAINSKIQ